MEQLFAYLRTSAAPTLVVPGTPIFDPPSPIQGGGSGPWHARCPVSRDWHMHKGSLSCLLPEPGFGQIRFSPRLRDSQG